MTTAAAATVSPPTAGTGVSIDQFAWAAFMISQMNAQGADVPYTVNNVDNIVRWMTAEESPSDWFHHMNPLNINAGGSGSDTFPNLTASATATAALIYGSYSGITNALEQNASPNNFSAAVVSSPWAFSHYGVAAAGAPSQYIVAGRGFDYIANIGLASSVVAGLAKDVLPADPGAVVPASPTPLGPLGSGVNVQPPAILSGLSGLETGIDTILTDITSTTWWKRVGIFVGGGILILGGIVLFVSTSKTGQEVKSEAPMAAAVAA
jgi:hypothetical protein